MTEPYPETETQDPAATEPSAPDQGEPHDDDLEPEDTYP
jgi:hypothetical protein